MFIEKLKQEKISQPNSLFEIDINLENFNPLEQNMWHYKFDPHSIDEIP